MNFLGGRRKGVGAYLSLSGSGSGREVGWGGGGVLIRGWALRNFFCLQGWALFRINTVYSSSKSRNFTDVCMVGAHKLAPHQTNVCKFSQLARQRSFY